MRNNLNRSQPVYSQEPKDNKQFTDDFDEFYTRFARAYDLFARYLPTWRNWLKRALPYIQGPRVLEISFGTGYLLTQYADRFQTFGIDYNTLMVRTAKENLSQRGLNADLQQADVNLLPFATDSFDTIVNTMAFSGYADGKRAINEMKRVLKPDGRLVIVDINYPKDRNWLGTKLIQLWMAWDIVRNMGELFESSGWEYEETEIGGFGSVHLYIARSR